MRAFALNGPGSFIEVDVDMPTVNDLADGEVLLEVLAGGVCGSDLPVFRGFQARWAPTLAKGELDRAGLPMHEVAGRVIASKSAEHAVGSHVVGWASRFNGLSEYVISSGEGLVEYDSSLDPRHAVIAQPLACVMYSLERTPELVGSSVAVLGLGPIGMMFAHMAKVRGARHVTGIDRVDRRDEGSVFGLDEVIHASVDRWAAWLKDEERPEVVIEAIGHNTVTLTNAIEACAPNGVINYFGIADDAVYPIPMMQFFLKFLTLRSGGTYERRRVLAEALEYMTENPWFAEAMATHTYPLSQVTEAFSAAISPAKGQLKIIIDCQA